MLNKILKNINDVAGFLVTDKLYLKLKFRYITGEKLNLKKPKTYNEKLQWLKLNDRRPEQLQYVDKYNVRSYIEENIGEKYLIPLIAVYEDVEQINWVELPDKFVIKCTHGSGSNIICHDKSKLDINDAKRKLKKWMKNNWYWYGREWSYKNLKPRIVCEQYLGENLVDYKVMCFHGVPKLIQIHQDRNNNEHTIDFYDTDWSKTNIRRKHTPSSKKPIPKPKNLGEMLGLAKELSKNEIHVRVDFYEVDEKIYFGEKTYYSAAGFAPFADKTQDALLGSWIQLHDNKKNINKV